VDSIIVWVKENPEAAAAIVIYLIANLAPRPDHSKLAGWRQKLWQIIDRLCLLTSHRVPGSLKFLLLDSPVRGSDEKVEKAPKSQDEESDSEPSEDDDDGEDESAVVVDADEDLGDADKEKDDSDGQ
jgi:hypothetical protein